jgi:hypothetical protein
MDIGAAAAAFDVVAMDAGGDVVDGIGAAARGPVLARVTEGDDDAVGIFAAVRDASVGHGALLGGIRS